MAMPLIKLPKYSGRTLSGMIITAKNEVRAVNRSAYTPITTAAFFRFFNLGWAISRFTWARVSSPLMASTECPNPTNKMNMVKWLSQVPFSAVNHPRESLSRVIPYFSGFGGTWKGAWKRVMVHHRIRITTITVVMIMIWTALVLD